VGTPFVTQPLIEFWETIFPQEDWCNLGQ
jgi:hypothetical protein